MNRIDPNAPTRRSLLAGGGALIIAFSLRSPASLAQEGGVAQAPAKAPLPGSLKDSPRIDSWIRIGEDGGVTVLTGKAELGQGIKTALLQVAAEELRVDVQQIKLITADTAQTPNEGYTAGSHSMQDSGTAILNAAGQARAILIGLAGKRLGVPDAQLSARDGAVVSADGRSIGYGELVAGDVLHVEAQPQSPLTDPANYRIIGKPIPRVDIPAKLTGVASYVQDLRLDRMVHARVVRPPSYHSRLRSIDAGPIESMPGVLKVIHDGNYLAVAAEREYRAVQAMQVLADAAVWDEEADLPNQADIYDYLLKLPAQTTAILDQGSAGAGAKTISATYRRPYQIHGSIGPSCAVAWMQDGAVTVWTHSQGVFPLRKALAEMLRLAPEQVHCIHMEGSGCYGHNAADDVAADAALIARAIPGRPVRVQWMRAEEHLWEPYGPAMVTSAKAALDAGGSIVGWDYDVWSNTHSTRPGAAGNLLAALHIASPFTPPPPQPLPQPEGGGDRNAIPLYRFAQARVLHHFIPAMPLRVSALRGLGAYMNIFSIESFMDELARAAEADPVEFRLRHLADERARDVIQAAAERFGWSAGALPHGHGRGFAFARYKNLGAYAAIAIEAEVERDTGRVRIPRVAAAVDSGQAVSPDGIRNQIEGGIMQSLSWTLYESVTFDNTRITSQDWSSYPILRFETVPGSVDVHVIDRPGQPYLGTGEAAQGPTAAAIANAVHDATGARIRELPLTRERIKSAVAA